MFHRHAFPDVTRGSVSKDPASQDSGKIMKAVIESQGDDQTPAAINRAVTVGFCAIRNFKELLNRWQDDRDQLKKYLNDFIQAITEIIEGQGGVSEKFNGNGILYVFGATGPNADDIFKAIVTALRIRYRMNKINRAWDFYRDDAWKVGLGISTGSALVVRHGTLRDCTYSFRGTLPAFTKGLGSAAAPSQIIITEEVFKNKNFQKDLFEIKMPFHVQARGTDYMTRVREIVQMVKGNEFI